MPKRKQNNQSDHSARISTATYQATLAKYRKLKEARDKQRDVSDVPIDNAKAQEELLSLLEETKSSRLHANSLLGI